MSGRADSALESETRTGIRRRGLMLVLSSPSGAGKTTISRLLLDRFDDLQMSVSVTTRAMRPDEVDGRDYHFIGLQEYQQRVEAGELLEHARVFDHFYGTPRGPVMDTLSSGRDVLFDIDWQGTQQIGETAREDLVSVFILPPDAAELERRLHARAQDSHEVIQRRMAAAAAEMNHWREYDYIVVNEDTERSVRQVAAILEAERLRRERQVGLFDFVQRVQQGL